jgi:hypothetical protein
MKNLLKTLTLFALVLSAANTIGEEKATALFQAAYDEHSHRIAKMYAKNGIQSYVSE